MAESADLSSRSWCAVAVSGGGRGCSKPPAQHAPPVPGASRAGRRKIAAPLTIEANGVVEPLQTVAVQAQVGGTLDDGDVQRGQTTSRPARCSSSIDPRPFEAALRQARGDARARRGAGADAQRDAERYKALVEKDYVTQVAGRPGAVGGGGDAGDGAVRPAPRSTTRALNLNYTTIRAPIAGRTGRLLVRQGNLVRRERATRWS